MAIPPITYSGSRESRNHGRRPSAGRRFSTTAQSVPALETPRTLCPKDGDAFSYDPAHLKAWYMPQEIWEQLPARLHGPLARLQHAGAAVLTGFSRLSEVGAATGVISEEDEDFDVDATKGAVGDSVVDCAPFGLSTLHERRLSARHDSFNSSVSGSSSFSIPATPPKTPTSRSGANTPPTPSPISPFTLKPQTHALPSLGIPAPPPSAEYPKLPSPTSTSNFFPANQQTSRYLAELSHLRSDCLVRLRHAARRVDGEFSEALRGGEFYDGFRLDPEAEADKADEVQRQFEMWWARKKELVQSLEARGSRLVRGWGA